MRKGNAHCYFSSAGYPTMLIPSGLEGKESLFSLPNIFSRTQPRHSGLTQGRFLPGVLHSYRLKRKRNHSAVPKEPDMVEFIWHSAPQSSALTTRQILPAHSGAGSDFQPLLAAGAVGPGCSGLSKIRPLAAHCTQTASVKLAIISGAWGSISVCEHSSLFGLWYIH